MSARYIIGDTRDVLATIPDGSVDLVLTSPPFLALRSYLPADHPDKHREIGSEPDPASFLDTLLALTADWRRVLAPHGSICVELGDTYAGGSAEGSDTRNVESARFRGLADGVLSPKAGTAWPLPKSLCGIPHLYHLSLAYGRNLLTGEESPAGQWRVRNVVAWCRPNPPVGALGDKFRPATSYLTIACPSGKRYFDLDAVRTVNDPDRMNRSDAGSGFSPGLSSAKGAGALHPAGAPPLDYWVIPTQPYSGKATTSRRVPCGPHDGGERTPSPDCPVHEGRSALPPTALRGERAGTEPTRTSRTDDRHEQGQLLDCEASDVSPDRSGSSPLPTSETSAPGCAPAAKPRSKAASRTVPAPATSAPGTTSAGSPDRTGDTSESPGSGGRRPGTTGSRTSGDESPDSRALRTADRTAGTGTEPVTSEACTCSFHRTVTESTSHYAVYPPALLERPIKSMVPSKVCTVCGEPSRRIVETEGLSGGDMFGPSNDRGVGLGGKRPPMPDITRTTIGWTDCGHDSWRNGVVLDPFAGSGTTLMVATGHGHDAIGCDIDARNADLALDRVGPLLLTVEHLTEQAAS